MRKFVLALFLNKIVNSLRNQDLQFKGILLLNLITYFQKICNIRLLNYCYESGFFFKAET